MLKEIKEAGVIWVMNQAKQAGYSPDDGNWVNFGQGSPEVGNLIGAPERLNRVEIEEKNFGYSPVEGYNWLRKQVALFYSQTYQNSENSVTDLNVCLCGGGRHALTRVLSVFEKGNVGYFVPDYASYEGILSLAKSLKAKPFLLPVEKGFQLNLNDLEEFVSNEQIDILLLSNPSNPLGATLLGDQLSKLIDMAARLDFYLILDEFYSNYLFVEDKSVSGAQFANLKTDKVILIDGLTKNWRYPGLRLSWVVGPTDVVEEVTKIGSFMDGGISTLSQLAAKDLLSTEVYLQEGRVLRRVFEQKRNLLIEELPKLGFKLPVKPTGGMYLWGDLSGLSTELQNGRVFLKHALEHKVIVTPGEFFNLNPYDEDRTYSLNQFVRFSFGPSIQKIEQGLGQLKKMLLGS